MRVAIDVEPAFGNVTGTGVYVKQMVTHLARVTREGQYSVFTSSSYRDAKGLDFDGNERFHRCTLPMSHKMCQGAWVLLDWPPVNRFRPGAVHCPDSSQA